MAELTLSLHLNSFPRNTLERKKFHLEEVHQSTEDPDSSASDGHDTFHRYLHLTAPCHGFGKGVVKSTPS